MVHQQNTNVRAKTHPQQLSLLLHLQLAPLVQVNPPGQKIIMVKAKREHGWVYTDLGIAAVHQQGLPDAEWMSEQHMEVLVMHVHLTQACEPGSKQS